MRHFFMGIIILTVSIFLGSMAGIGVAKYVGNKTMTPNLRVQPRINHVKTSKGLECVVYGSINGGIGMSCNWDLYNSPQNYGRKN